MIPAIVFRDNSLFRSVHLLFRYRIEQLVLRASILGALKIEPSRLYIKQAQSFDL